MAPSVVVTSFHVAILAMSVVFTVMLMLQVLCADPSHVTRVGGVVALVLFPAFCAQARFVSEKMAEQAHRSWRIGAAHGETAGIYAEVFRARSWILPLGLTGPVLVPLARVFFFGALGDVGQMLAAMLLGDKTFRTPGGQGNDHERTRSDRCPRRR